MRLLHTSDWHLGRSFHREDLLGAQARFVDFLVATARSERADAVLVSGDIYDRALPGVDAVQLCDEALRRLGALSVPTVLISGNHDSARRLGFGADLMASAGVHLRTAPDRCDQPVLLDTGRSQAAIYGIPYLEPAAVRADLAVEEPGHRAVLRAAMERIRTDLTRRSPTRSVVLAHAFVTGSSGSDSERDIGDTSVGGAAAVPATVFDGMDYVALGHLHGAQAVSERIRYSGSPLAYSFSEEHHTKGVWLVELAEPGAPPRVEQLPCPVERPLARISGRLEQLLTEDRWSRYENHRLQVTLTDPGRPVEPMERLRRRFPHTLVLAFEPEGGPRDGRGGYSERVRGLDDLTLASGFVEHVRGSAAEPGEQALLRMAFSAGRDSRNGQDGDR